MVDVASLALDPVPRLLQRDGLADPTSCGHNIAGRKLIEALNTLIKSLQADRTAQGLKEVDFAAFQGLLTEAGKIATDVASIDPPGCAGPPPY